MHNVSFFVRDLLDAENWESFTETQREAIKVYLLDLQRGPADGEMDIEWQAVGNSYYKHLLLLDELEGRVKDDYLTKLRDDIGICRAIWPGNYVIENVAKKIGESPSTEE